MRAYVVITAGPGKAREIARAVAVLPGVKMSNACWGSPGRICCGRSDRSEGSQQTHNGQNPIHRTSGPN
jgi:hypothetical protein